MKMKSKLKKETETLEQFLSRVEDYSNRVDSLATNVETLKSVNNRILNEPSQTERKKHLSSQAEIVSSNKVQGRRLQKEIKEEKQKLAKLSGDLTGAEKTIRKTQLQTISQRFLEVWTEYNTVQLEFRQKNKKALLRNMRVVDPGSTISEEELEKRLDEGDVTVLSSILKESDQAKEDLKLLERRHSEFVKLEGNHRDQRDVHRSLPPCGDSGRACGQDRPAGWSGQGPGGVRQGAAEAGREQ